MNHRGLKNRKRFQEDLAELCTRQGIIAINVAFVTDKGTEQIDSVITKPTPMCTMLKAVRHLDRYTENMNRMHKTLEPTE